MRYTAVQGRGLAVGRRGALIRGPGAAHHLGLALGPVCAPSVGAPGALERGMYTGITRGTFPVVAVERRPTLLTYQVDLGELAVGLELGASVSVDGVCQTVVALAGGVVTFDAIEETLRRTTLDTLEVGQRVAIERSARYGDEIGGHEMAGHVVGTGEVVEARAEGDDVSLVIAVPREWMKHILPKGFIGVDGSSLTVGTTWPDGRFSLHLIPETLRLTNLGRKRVGDRVNVELDARTVAIVETVERVLAERAGGV